MIKLSEPLKLNMGMPPFSVSTSFEEKLLSNYSLFSAQITPKDLLLLTTASLELPETIGGMTTIAVDASSHSSRNITLNVINNVVNRILMSERSDFTYQDRIYISTALKKFGVTDISEFMRQVHNLRENTVSIQRLKKLYQNNMSLFQHVSGQVQESGEQGRKEAEQAGGYSLPLPQYYLQSDIYHRLETAKIYQSVQAYNQSSFAFANTLFRNELKVTEQARVSNEFHLWELKQKFLSQSKVRFTYYAPDISAEEESGNSGAGSGSHTARQEGPDVVSANQIENNIINHITVAQEKIQEKIDRSSKNYVFFHPHINRYEQAGLLPAPATEEEVLSQGAEAVLLSLIDNVTVSQVNRLLSNNEAWIDIRNAVSQSMQNSLLRFQMYHTEQSFGVQQEDFYHKQVTSLYREEEVSVRNIFQEFSNLEEAYSAQIVDQSTSRQQVNLEYNLEPDGEGLENETGNQETRQMINSEMKRELASLTKEILLGGAQPGKAPKGPDGKEQLPPEFHRELIRRQMTELFAQSTETIRELTSAEALILAAEQLPGSAAEMTRQTVNDIVNLFVNNQYHLGSQNILQPDVLTVFSSGAELEPPLEMVYPQTEEQAPAIEEQIPPKAMPRQMADQQKIIQELDRINEHNREVLKQVQLEQQEKAKEAKNPPPADPKKIFRDSLAALENPEQFIQEFQNQAPEMAHPQSQDPFLETILEHADSTTKKIYETIVQYQNNPDQILAAGIVRPANVGQLDADLNQARLQQEELIHLQRQQQEKDETIREHVETVVERFLEQPNSLPSQAPVGKPGSRPGIHIVHRAAENQTLEEFLELLEERKVGETRQVIENSTVAKESVNQTEINNLTQQVVEKTTEDITEMINRTLAKQLGTISDRVYTQMERRLQSERSRRGWI